MGAKYLNEARSDFIECLSAIHKTSSENSLVLEIKVHYASGILEIQYGPDLKRAEYHFDAFLTLYKKLSRVALNQNSDWIQEFVKNIEKYKQ